MSSKSNYIRFFTFVILMFLFFTTTIMAMAAEGSRRISGSGRVITPTATPSSIRNSVGETTTDLTDSNDTQSDTSTSDDTTDSTSNNTDKPKSSSNTNALLALGALGAVAASGAAGTRQLYKNKNAGTDTNKDNSDISSTRRLSTGTNSVPKTNNLPVTTRSIVQPRMVLPEEDPRILEVEKAAESIGFITRVDDSPSNIMSLMAFEATNEEDRYSYSGGEGYTADTLVEDYESDLYFYGLGEDPALMDDLKYGQMLSVFNSKYPQSYDRIKEAFDIIRGVPYESTDTTPDVDSDEVVNTPLLSIGPTTEDSVSWNYENGKGGAIEVTNQETGELVARDILNYDSGNYSISNADPDVTYQAAPISSGDPNGGNTDLDLTTSATSSFGGELGAIIQSIIDNPSQFFVGIIDGLANNIYLGIPNWIVDKLRPNATAPDSLAYQAGKIFGDIAAINAGALAELKGLITLGGAAGVTIGTGGVAALLGSLAIAGVGAAELSYGSNVVASAGSQLAIDADKLFIDAGRAAGTGGGVESVAKLFGDLNIKNIPNMSKSEILEMLPNEWKVFDNNGFVHVKDGNSTRLRIDPPDNVVNYDHVHLYDDMGNSLDINGQIVDYRSIDAHIPYTI